MSNMNVKNKSVYRKLVLMTLGISFVLYVLYLTLKTFYFSTPLESQENTNTDTTTVIKQVDVKKDLDSLVVTPSFIYNDSALIENEIKKLSNDIYSYMTEVGYRDSTFQCRLDYVTWLYKKKGLTKKQNTTLYILKNLLMSLPKKKLE